jgi:Protein of unknown function (DUF732)
MNTRAALAAIAVGAAGLVVGVGIAKGDTEDENGYIAALVRDGITSSSVGVGQELEAGETICRDLRKGESQSAIIDWLIDPPHPVPSTVAIDLVVDAHLYLCPDVSSVSGGTRSTSAGLG